MTQPATPDIRQPLVSGLIGALVAVIIAEPIRVWLRNLVTVAQMRKHIYAELCHNLVTLHDLFNLAERAQLTPGYSIDLKACSKNAFRKTRYESALKEAMLFYRLKDADWIDHQYVMFEKVTVEDIDDSYMVSLLGVVLADGLDHLEAGRDRKWLIRRLAVPRYEEIRAGWQREKRPYVASFHN